jgi:hypothetical protein
LLCAGHVERESGLGIVYGAPPSTHAWLIPERVERAAKESYRFSCSISGNPNLPAWDEADELTKIKFLSDAEHNIVEKLPAGRN